MGAIDELVNYHQGFIITLGIYVTLDFLMHEGINQLMS